MRGGDDMFKFVFVRNPFDRLVSAYISKFIGRSRHDKNRRHYYDFEFDFKILSLIHISEPTRPEPI
eukprot:2274756-Pyramimonas_sp.AAC.1